MAQNQFLGIDYQHPDRAERTNSRIKKSRAKLEKIIKAVGAKEGRVEVEGEKDVWEQVKDCKMRQSIKELHSKDEQSPSLTLPSQDLFRRRYNQLNSIPIQPLPYRPPTPTITTTNKIGSKSLQHLPRIDEKSAQFGLRRSERIETQFGQKAMEYLRQKDLITPNHSRKVSDNAKPTTVKEIIRRARSELGQAKRGELGQARYDENMRIRKDREYVRQIFKDSVDNVKRREFERVLKEKYEEQLDERKRRLEEKEAILKYVVYVRANKHLKNVDRERLSYLEQLRSEAKVDQSIFTLLRSKIQRMKTVSH